MMTYNSTGRGRRQVVRHWLPKPGFRGFESRRPLQPSTSKAVSLAAFVHHMVILNSNENETRFPVFHPARLVQLNTVSKSYEVRKAFQEKSHEVVQQLGKLGPYHLATPACVKGIIAHLSPFEKKHIFRHG